MKVGSHKNFPEFPSDILHLLITHSLMSSYLSLVPVLTPLLVILGIVSQINHLHMNSYLRVYFRENPD